MGSSVQSCNLAAEFSPRSSAQSRNVLFTEHRPVAQLGLHSSWAGSNQITPAGAEFHPFMGQELDAGLWHGHRLSELSRAGVVLQGRWVLQRDFCFGRVTAPTEEQRH